MTKEITRDALAAALQSPTPPIVFEVLPRKYFAAGHIPTARPLPLDELDAIVSTAAADKTMAIVVYCASATCRSSHEAAARLAGLGYSSVAVYVGGKQDWQDAGLRLEV